MLFGLFSLKRKFFAIADECDDDAITTNCELYRPRKRLRVLGPASIHEAKTQQKLAACTVGFGREDVEEEDMLDELQEKVKQLEELNLRIKKEAEQIAAKLKKVQEDVECMVCQDMVDNPQLLKCGHSACYRCLRNWWTQPPDEYDGAEIIETEAEADRDELDHEGEDPAPEPHPRGRHEFPSAVNRKKICPYCNEVVTCRPVPDFQLRAIVETLNKDLAPVPPHIQARRQARLTRRRDLWHGMFHPKKKENDTTEQDRHMVGRHRDIEPDPPPHHPDPILNHIAQAQYRRAVEAIVDRRERLRVQAYEAGRLRGIWEIRLQWERAERARRAAVDAQIQEQGLAPDDIPPVPQGAPGGDLQDGRQILQDPVPDPPPPNDPAAM